MQVGKVIEVASIEENAEENKYKILTELNV